LMILVWIAILVVNVLFWIGMVKIFS
jgi:hypothetical protein